MGDDTDKKIAALEETVYKGSDSVYPQLVLTQEIKKLRVGAALLEKRINQLETEDRKSRSHITYLLIILFITMIINMLSRNNILERIRIFLGF